MNFSLVLASSSPRRRELLGLTGLKFDVRPADIDEAPWPGEAPGDYVLRLAVGKAHAASAQGEPRQVVLAADTTVADGTALLGKPADQREAVTMLEQLRGRVHQVYTAIAVQEPGAASPSPTCAPPRCRCGPTPLRRSRLTPPTGDPLDKAGAYAIQHAGFHPVEGFAGCFASVMGLPVVPPDPYLQKKWALCPRLMCLRPARSTSVINAPCFSPF